MAAVVLVQPQPRASIAAQRLTDAGQRVVVLSFQQLLEDTEQLHRLADTDVAEFDRIVFVSPSSVYFSADTLKTKLRDSQIAAIGQGTATVLLETGLIADDARLTRPRQPPFDAQALLALPQMDPHHIGRLLVIRGHDGRTDWQDRYRAAGAQVEEAIVYRSVPTTPDNARCAEMQTLADGQEPAVVVVGSISQLRGLQQWLAGQPDTSQLAGWLHKQPTVVPHARIASALSAHGWTDVRPTGAGQTLVQAALSLANK